MVVSPEGRPPNGFESGNQHDRSMSVKSTQTDFPRNHQKLCPFSPSLSTSPWKLIEDHKERRAKSADRSLYSKLPFDEEDIRLDFTFKAHKNPELNKQTLTKTYEKSFSDLMRQEFDEPRRPQSVVLPSFSGSSPQESTNLSQQSPAAEDSSPHLPFEMDSPEIPFDLPILPGPGPGPGPGPKTRLSKETLQPARINVDYQTQQQSPAMFDKEWGSIEKLRNRTRILRSQLQELRKELRQKQYAKSAADDYLIQYFRRNTSSATALDQDMSQQQTTLSSLLQECQEARDQYGPLEDDCNLMEDQLGREEVELTKLEAHFYGQQTELQNLGGRISSAVIDSPAVASTDSEVGSDDNFHPRVSEYLSKLGDIDILQERLDENYEEKETLEEEKAYRLRLPLPRDLGEDEQEWLDNFDSVEAGLLAELKIAEAKAHELKNVCLEAGLIDENGNPTSFETQEKQYFKDEEMIDKKNCPESFDAPEERKLTDLEGDNAVGAKYQVSDFVKFPALLAEHGTKEIQLKDCWHEQQPNELFDSTGDRINQWLLFQLRLSPLCVILLAQIYETLSGTPIKFTENWQNKWQHLVLDYWWKDKAVKSAHHYRVYSSGILTQASCVQTHVTPHIAPKSGIAAEITQQSSMQQAEQLANQPAEHPLQQFSEQHQHSDPQPLLSRGRHWSLAGDQARDQAREQGIASGIFGGDSSYGSACSTKSNQ
jgi:hypothetical protein